MGQKMSAERKQLKLAELELLKARDNKVKANMREKEVRDKVKRLRDVARPKKTGGVK